MILVELEIRKARWIAEWGWLGVERDAMQTIVDLARLRRRGGGLGAAADPVVAGQHHERTEQAGRTASHAVAKPQQQVVIADRTQQREPALALRRLAACGHLDSDPRGGRRHIERD